MNSKKQLGQFYTTNYKKILNGLYISQYHEVVEPFVGQGDLLEFINGGEAARTVEMYDIDPKISGTIKRDTILEPPDYTNKFVVTNPPYLARNKNSDKTLYDIYNTNDLYKCFIKTLLESKPKPLGGILIIPLNFWCSVRKADVLLRKMFLKEFHIIRLNIFEEPVFEDTNYSVCSFLFTLHEIERGDNAVKPKVETKGSAAPSGRCPPQSGVVPTIFYPSNEEIIMSLNDENNYSFGPSLSAPSGCIVTRLTRKNVDTKFKTNLLLSCIDGTSNGTSNKKINLKYVENTDKYIDNTPNLSARSFVVLVIEPMLETCLQKDLAHRFNKHLNEHRKKYHSLFLTEYREKSRKRISFEFAYRFVQHQLNEMLVKP